MSDKGENIKCLVRCRPLNSNESGLGTKCITISSDSKVVFVENKAEKGQKQNQQYAMDKVFNEDINQIQLFDEVGIPILQSFIAGYNCTIFCYGQTGAGKTHTMMGPLDALFETDSEAHGLIPRIIDFLFNQKEQVRNLITNNTTAKCKNITMKVKTCVMEIYQEQIIDLLNCNTNPQKGDKKSNQAQELPELKVKEDPKKGMYIQGITEVEIKSAKEAKESILTGLKSRHVAATAMNAESSRSHMIFTLYLDTAYIDEKGGEVTKSSRLHLIDLAGSERQKKTKATGDRVKEAGNINKSLSTLGNVINALVENCEGKNKYVPFRDSKLTYFLKDSLGGNSKTTIVANISMSLIQVMETISTLKFVQRAKMIKNQATKNVSVQENIEALQDEIKKLKNMLKDGGGGGAGGAGTCNIILDENGIPTNFTCPICHNQPIEITQEQMIQELKKEIIEMTKTMADNLKEEENVNDIFGKLNSEILKKGGQFFKLADKYKDDNESKLKDLDDLIETFKDFCDDKKSLFTDIAKKVLDFRKGSTLDKIVFDNVTQLNDSILNIKKKLDEIDLEKYKELENENSNLKNLSPTLNEMKNLFEAQRNRSEIEKKNIAPKAAQLETIANQFSKTNQDFRDFVAKNFLNTTIFKDELIVLEKNKYDMLNFQLEEHKMNEKSLEKKIEELESENYLLSVDLLRMKSQLSAYKKTDKEQGKKEEDDKELATKSDVGSYESDENDDVDDQDYEPVPVKSEKSTKKIRKGIFQREDDDGTEQARKNTVLFAGNANLNINQKEILRFKEQIDELNEDLSNKIAENSELKEKVYDLEQKLEENKAKIEELENENESLNEDIQALDESNEMYTNHMEILMNYIRETSADIENLLAKNEEKDEKMEKLTENYNTLYESLLKKVEDDHDEKQALMKNIQEDNKNIQKLVEYTKDTEAAINDLEVLNNEKNLKYEIITEEFQELYDFFYKKFEEDHEGKINLINRIGEHIKEKDKLKTYINSTSKDLDDLRNLNYQKDKQFEVVSEGFSDLYDILYKKIENDHKDKINLINRMGEHIARIEKLVNGLKETEDELENIKIMNNEKEKGISKLYELYLNNFEFLQKKVEEDYKDKKRLYNKITEHINKINYLTNHIKKNNELIQEVIDMQAKKQQDIEKLNADYEAMFEFLNKKVNNDYKGKKDLINKIGEKLEMIERLKKIIKEITFGIDDLYDLNFKKDAMFKVLEDKFREIYEFLYDKCADDHRDKNYLISRIGEHLEHIDKLNKNIDDMDSGLEEIINLNNTKMKKSKELDELYKDLFDALNSKNTKDHREKRELIDKNGDNIKLIIKFAEYIEDTGERMEEIRNLNSQKDQQFDELNASYKALYDKLYGKIEKDYKKKKNLINQLDDYSEEKQKINETIDLIGDEVEEVYKMIKEKDIKIDELEDDYKKIYQTMYNKLYELNKHKKNLRKNIGDKIDIINKLLNYIDNNSKEIQELYEINNNKDDLMVELENDFKKLYQVLYKKILELNKDKKRIRKESIENIKHIGILTNYINESTKDINELDTLNKNKDHLFENLDYEFKNFYKFIHKRIDELIKSKKKMNSKHNDNMNNIHLLCDYIREIDDELEELIKMNKEKDIKLDEFDDVSNSLYRLLNKKYSENQSIKKNLNNKLSDSNKDKDNLLSCLKGIRADIDEVLDLNIVQDVKFDMLQDTFNKIYDSLLQKINELNKNNDKITNEKDEINNTLSKKKKLLDSIDQIIMEFSYDNKDDLDELSSSIDKLVEFINYLSEKYLNDLSKVTKFYNNVYLEEKRLARSKVDEIYEEQKQIREVVDSSNDQIDQLSKMSNDITNSLLIKLETYGREMHKLRQEKDSLKHDIDNIEQKYEFKISEMNLTIDNYKEKISKYEKIENMHNLSDIEIMNFVDQITNELNENDENLEKLSKMFNDNLSNISRFISSVIIPEKKFMLKKLEENDSNINELKKDLENSDYKIEDILDMYNKLNESYLDKCSALLKTISNQDINYQKLKIKVRSTVNSVGKIEKDKIFLENENEILRSNEKQLNERDEINKDKINQLRVDLEKNQKQIEELNNQILEIFEQIKEKENIINELKSAEETNKEQYANLENKLKSFDEIVLDKDNLIKSLENDAKKLREQIDLLNNNKAQILEDINKKAENFSKLNDENNDLNKKLALQNDKLLSLFSEITNKSQQIDNLNDEINKLNTIIKENKKIRNDMTNKIKEHGKDMTKLQTVNTNNNKKIEELNNKIKSLNEEIEAKNKKINKLNDDKEFLKKEVSDKDEQITKLYDKIKASKQEIFNLQTKSHKLAMEKTNNNGIKTNNNNIAFNTNNKLNNINNNYDNSINNNNYLLNELLNYKESIINYLKKDNRDILSNLFKSQQNVDKLSTKCATTENLLNLQTKIIDEFNEYKKVYLMDSSFNNGTNGNNNNNNNNNNNSNQQGEQEGEEDSKNIKEDEIKIIDSFINKKEMDSKEDLSKIQIDLLDIKKNKEDINKEILMHLENFSVNLKNYFLKYIENLKDNESIFEKEKKNRKDILELCENIISDIKYIEPYDDDNSLDKNKEQITKFLDRQSNNLDKESKILNEIMEHIKKCQEVLNKESISAQNSLIYYEIKVEMPENNHKNKQNNNSNSNRNETIKDRNIENCKKYIKVYNELINNIQNLNNIYKEYLEKYVDKIRAVSADKLLIEELDKEINANNISNNKLTEDEVSNYRSQLEKIKEKNKDRENSINEKFKRSNIQKIINIENIIDNDYPNITQDQKKLTVSFDKKILIEKKEKEIIQKYLVTSMYPKQYSTLKHLLMSKINERKKNVLEEKLKILFGDSLIVENIYNDTPYQQLWNSADIPKLQKKIILLKEEKYKLQTDINVLFGQFSNGLRDGAGNSQIRMLFLIREENKKLKKEVKEVKLRNVILQEQIRVMNANFNNGNGNTNGNNLNINLNEDKYELTEDLDNDNFDLPKKQLKKNRNISAKNTHSRNINDKIMAKTSNISFNRSNSKNSEKNNQNKNK